MTIVNANGRSALEVYARIKGFGISAIWPDTFPGSFSEWVDDDGLRTWVQEYAGPFTSLTDPDELARRLEAEAQEQLGARPGS